jgi:hypothetical protein
MVQYFTDTERGPKPRTVDGIDQRVWGGLYTLIDGRISDSSFGRRFPAYCSDGNAACGCDTVGLARVLAAEVPMVEWPLSPDLVPSTPVVMDLLEFCAGAVGERIDGHYHSYFQHYHLTWDREMGLSRFVDDVNLLFGRNGLAYEMSPAGEVRRLLPQPLAEALARFAPFTGDAEMDRLLESSRRHIASPKPDIRQDALEKIWDAFERLKTLEGGGDKKQQADALLDRVAASGSKLRTMLGKEALALTDIGNTFRIRHSETTQEILSSGEHLDYLFWRMFAFISMILRGTNRGR